MRATFLPFHLPQIGDEEIRAVTETLQSGWITSGPRVRAFEAAFADYVGARFAVALNSCTAALHLSLDALGVGPGDEVIVPAMTFTATAEVAVHLGARPVLVDVEPDTLNLDAAAVERAIGPRTKAIVAVHYAGLPCDMRTLEEVASRRGIPIVEDAAHALPASRDGRVVGGGPNLTCFSFYATKTITTGEGGMVTTSDERLADRVRMMSLHGISHDGWKRYTATGSWFYEVLEAGHKCNMTDIAAALGLEQLKKARAFHCARTRIAAQYDAAFAELREIEPAARRDNAEHSWHLYVIKLDLARLRLDRAGFVEAMRERGIGCSVHFIPLHLHPYYRRELAIEPGALPVASSAYERIVSLPIYPAMSNDDVRDVSEAVRTIVAAYRR